MRTARHPLQFGRDEASRVGSLRLVRGPSWCQLGAITDLSSCVCAIYDFCISELKSRTSSVAAKEEVKGERSSDGSKDRSHPIWGKSQSQYTGIRISGHDQNAKSSRCECLRNMLTLMAR